MVDEIRKYIKPLVRLRQAAAELEKMSEFELSLLALKLGLDEDGLHCFAHDSSINGTEGEDEL